MTTGSAKVPRVDAAARVHILDGDRRGGGHGPGRTAPGKTGFPDHCSDDACIAAIEDLARDASLPRSVEANGRVVLVGIRDGIQIHVVIEKGGSRIITAYPVGETPR